MQKMFVKLYNGLIRQGFVLTLILFFILGNETELFSACNPPVPTNYTNRQLTSITVNWANLSSNDAWEIELRKSDDPFTGNATTGTINDLFYNFQGLETGTEYCFRIRGICDGEPGGWSAPFCFISTLNDSNSCGLGFELKDPTGNQSYADADFYYITDQFINGELGKDVFIKDVQLIIEHNWPSDLEIFLFSPAGNRIILSQKNGFNSVHYGNPGSESCDSVALFSDEACNEVGDLPNLTGAFRPEESFLNLYDSSAIDNTWKLVIRDHNAGHLGKLHYFHINLVETDCRLPEAMYVEPFGPNACKVSWESGAQNFNQIQIEYGESGFEPGSGSVFIIDSGQNEYIVSGLESNSEYEIYIKSICEGTESSISCPFPVITECNSISLKEDFNESELCELECSVSCLVSGAWFNNSFPYNQWLVNSGATATEGTGPKEDLSGFGNYIYLESSENECDFDSLAILQTDCIEIFSNMDGCDLSFYYNMNGPDIGSLSLEISTDDGVNWTSLFDVEGDQGENWYNVNLDLHPYNGLVGRFRFVAILKSGENTDRGDIALDDITFYGSTLVVEAQYLFFVDEDDDDYGADDAFFFCSNALVSGYSRNNLDCDDTNLNINPGAVEIPCNSIDENCNGLDDDFPVENPMSFVVADQIDESCDGSVDGSIIPGVNGGEAPYLFLWSDGSQDSILTNIGAGKYQCEVTDQLGCILVSDSLEINAGSPMDFFLLEKSIVSCQGATDGWITIDHTGGVGPFIYEWNNGDSSKNIEELGPGKYQLTITDLAGCQLVSPEIILGAATNFTVGIQITEPSCTGNDDGKIRIIGIQNGQSPFSYQWNTGDTTDQIIDLTAGSYALTVTDGTFCYEVYDSINIIDPLPVSGSLIAKDNVSCYGDNDGAIEVNTSGGHAPYTFKWTRNGQLFSTKDDLFNLKAGVYQLTLRDNNACEFRSDSIWIVEPAAIQIGLDTIQFADCSASENGMIDVNVMGGSGDFQFYWNGLDQGGDSYENLSPGLYNVVVTDKYGCKGFRGGIQLGFLDIPLETELNLLKPLLCFGDSSASVELIVTDAELPADFNWSAGVKHVKDQSRDTLYFLNSGNYNVTVTDAEGCVGIAEWLTISQPGPLNYELLDLQELLCANDHSGSIEIDASGGISPYIIEWSNGDKGELINFLDGGFYFATLTDENQCTKSIDSIFVFEPDSLKVQVITEAAHSGLNNGSASVIVSGGTSPYYFLWDENAGSQTSSKATGLGKGEYWCTLTDYQGCEKLVYVYVDSDDVAADDTDLSKGLLVYPNPASRTLHIVSNIENQFIRKISIYDLLGRNVFEDSKEEGVYQIEINSAELDNGVYLLLIETRGAVIMKQISILH